MKLHRHPSEKANSICGLERNGYVRGLRRGRGEAKVGRLGASIANADPDDAGAGLAGRASHRVVSPKAIDRACAWPTMSVVE